MPKTDRREFLARSTAAAAVLGFPFVGRISAAAGADTAADDSTRADRPTFDYAAVFATARERMEAQHKPGVVIVIPPDADDAAALKLALTATLLPRSLTNGQRWATGRLFSRAVFVVLPWHEVRKRLPGADADALCLILDAAGNVIETVPAPARPVDAAERLLPAAVLGATFIADMNARLDGPDGRRLAADAKAERAARADGGKEVDRLLAGLAAPDAGDAERAAAAKALAELVATAAAIMLEKRSMADRELALRIDDILVAACGGIPVGPDSPGLPHGVQCHEVMITIDPCPLCGLGRAAAPTARRFLHFLSSPEAATQASPPRSSPAVQPY